ncbi:MAG: hypothetical protein KDK39_14790 [Leptospiraceae bacterium]|nr:hypothetical protein [Leptospiraceae bacterium]
MNALSFDCRDFTTGAAQAAFDPVQGLRVTDSRFIATQVGNIAYALADDSQECASPDINEYLLFVLINNTKILLTTLPYI